MMLGLFLLPVVHIDHKQRGKLNPLHIKESMINYKVKKYSVPTQYIGLKVNITETSDGNISIYYNKDFVVCHPLSENKFNYKIGHMHEILKSDACKHLTDKEIS